MEPLRSYITQKIVEAAQHLTPILKASKFKETGVITPDEFVAAGDHLVHHCPTWQWAKGDSSKIKTFLPPDKQFIMTKNVPCYKRVKQMDSHTADQEKIIEEDADGGWVDTHHYSSTNQVTEAVSELKIKKEPTLDKVQLDNRPLIGKMSKNGDDVSDEEEEEDDDDDEEPVNMAMFIRSGKLAEVVKDNNTTAAATKQQQQQQMLPTAVVEAQPSNILQTRTYDLYITYDTYYQTPRMWLSGYNELRRPLTVEEMYEDISQDHAHKTVTMETHPHIATSPMASVHPCRHAEVMKRIIETVAEGGCELGVHLYLMIFLKFVQTVMPTIEYDFTHNFVLEKQ
ncbi:hypothetical protein HELRODRAFT_185193 [Helobdella robusta]|uniref:Ubiquitin-like-conjugating enzyme ATG3 n=1 Tax=Helobdella robusta TaxID=6412 RepID=T1FMH6_HELRO|nr:hypothetical protein HELRODRAFT_185193 [Helobdella robusta]ESN91640.1 hypothetical protein HELRODRAFT_185193 [Helobdella robusta]